MFLRTITGCGAIAALLFGFATGAQARGGTVECRSVDRQYNECKTSFRSAALIEQTSHTDCVENQSWGFNQQTGYVWVSGGCSGTFGEATYVERGVYDDRDSRSRDYRETRRGREIECSSNGYKFTRCGGNWRSARLVQQLSDSRCIENQSWGVDGEGLWVDQGCSGRFAEDGGRYDDRHTSSGYDYNPADGGGSTIVCESRDSDHQRCGLPRGVREVHIDEQLSQTPCRRGENWDYDDREIWVSAGCRARFRVW